jgi:NADH dehydrogenase
VVHLASVIRDQPAGSIEELSGIAAWRLVQAAERAGVERFVFFSVLGASTRSRPRLMRAKAIAERALMESSLSYTVFAPSLVYSPGDPFMRLLEWMSLLPVMPIPGAGRACSQPIWAEDVADCVMAALPGGAMADAAAGARYELAGPETLSYKELVAFLLRSLRRRRPVVSVPNRIVQRTLKWVELLMGPTAPVTWDEVELLQESLVSPGGTADAERLGVSPRTVQAVLGVS